MSTLFLIGNGFDLNCGMGTRYKDVYVEYVKEKSSLDVVNQFKKDISSDFEKWSDFELAMAKHAELFESEDDLLECMRDFNAFLNRYLQSESDLFHQVLNQEEILAAVSQEMRNSLSDFYSHISHNVDTIMNKRNAGALNDIKVISFNYTDAFEIILKNVYSGFPVAEPNVVHIHGVLQDDPVLGVDNETQINAKFSLTRRGKRGIIKPYFNELYDINRVRQAKKDIEQALTICTFGVSFGESDLMWRNEIVNWLKKDKSHHLFMYDYECSQKTYRTIDEKLDIEDDAKEKLLSSWKIEMDEDLFEQIHIPCSKNIFNIEQVIKETKKHLSDKKKKMIEENVLRGEKFIEQHIQEDAM